MTAQAPRPAGSLRRRRDRRGRGLRGPLGPHDVPVTRSRSDRFDDLVLDAVERLERRWGAELADVEFAVEDVPDVALPMSGPDVLADSGVPLAQAHPRGLGGVSGPLVVLYRRPLESRALDAEDLAALIENVVIDRVAHLLGRDPAELDPHFDDRDTDD